MFDGSGVKVDRGDILPYCRETRAELLHNALCAYCWSIQQFTSRRSCCFLSAGSTRGSRSVGLTCAVDAVDAAVKVSHSEELQQMVAALVILCCPRDLLPLYGLRRGSRMGGSGSGRGMGGDLREGAVEWDGGAHDPAAQPVTREGRAQGRRQQQQQPCLARRGDGDAQKHREAMQKREQQ